MHLKTSMVRTLISNIPRYFLIFCTGFLVCDALGDDNGAEATGPAGPVRSLEPVGPGRAVILALFGILGLILGIFAAFFAEFLAKARAATRRERGKIGSATAVGRG